MCMCIYYTHAYTQYVLHTHEYTHSPYTHAHRLHTGIYTLHTHIYYTYMHTLHTVHTALTLYTCTHTIHNTHRHTHTTYIHTYRYSHYTQAHILHTHKCADTHAHSHINVTTHINHWIPRDPAADNIAHVLGLCGHSCSRDTQTGISTTPGNCSQNSDRTFLDKISQSRDPLRKEAERDRSS